MDKFRQMDTFLRIAQTRSFTSVSSQLGLSPAAVARQVNALEARLGTRLLNRSTRSLSLTEAGKSYAEMCERVVRDVAHCEHRLSVSEKDMSGTIRMVVPPSFGSKQLGDAVIDFSRKHPDISISIQLGCISSRSNDFVESEFDVALRWGGDLRKSSLVATKLGNQLNTLCASRRYLEQHGIPRTPEDLNSHNCLVHLIAQPQRIWRFVDGDQEIGVRVAGDFSSDSVIMLHKSVMSDRGLSVLPLYSVRDDLISGTLVEVLPKYKIPSLPLFLLYREKRLLPARVRLFIDFLRVWFMEREDLALADAASSRRERDLVIPTTFVRKPHRAGACGRN